MQQAAPIIAIGDLLVSPEIVTEFFACDYEVCRGVCCIVGESGAPLEEEEAAQLEREYPRYAEWLSDEARAKVESEGFFEVDRDGDLVTPLLGNSEECVFTRFETDKNGSGADGKPCRNCLCAIEMAHNAGRCKFVKPISCRLYPIRVTRFKDGSRALNLHRWDICAPAFAKGKREGIRVWQFLRAPLIDAFGEEFYRALQAAAEHFNG